MEITPFVGGVPPEPEADMAGAQAPAAAPTVQSASLAGPAASFSQLAAAAAPAETAPGAVATRLAESSVLAQATKLHLQNLVGDLPGPMPDTARSAGGRDLVSVESEDEEPPLQANTLDGGGAPGGRGRDLVSYTPITIPNTLDGEGVPGGPGGDLRSFTPIPLPDTLDRRGQLAGSGRDLVSYTPITIPNTLDGEGAPGGPGGDLVGLTPIQLPNVPDEASSVGGVRTPGGGLAGITPINLPNTPDGGSVPPGPGGGDPVGLREALQAKLLNLHTESSSVGGVAGQGAAGVGITPINLPNTPDGGSTPPGPGGGDPVRQK